MINDYYFFDLEIIIIHDYYGDGVYHLLQLILKELRENREISLAQLARNLG